MVKISHSVGLLIVGAVVFSLLPLFKPAVKIDLAELDDTILKRQWNSVVGSNYSSQEWLQIKQDAKDQQILHRQAISLGLHKIDPVVIQRLTQLDEYLGVSDMAGLEYGDEITRRRLIQLMEEKLVTQADIVISDGEIADYYNLTTDNSLSAPRISFKHIFLATSDIPQNILSELNSGSEIKGDAFLAGHDFQKVSESSVNKSFGIYFFTQLNLRSINRWQGPINSSFGYHWVSLSEYLPPQKLTLLSQQTRIRSALYEKRRKQVLTAQIIKLRDNYRNGWVSPPDLPASSS